MKLLIERGIIIGFLINLIILFGFGVVTYQRFKTIGKLQQPESRRFTFSLNTEALVSEMNSFGNTTKEFALTKNESYIDFANQSDITRKINYLRRIFSENPVVLKKIGELDALVSERMQLNFRTIEAVKQEKDQAEIAELISRNWKLRWETDKLIARIENEAEQDFNLSALNLHARDNRLKLLQQLTFSMAVVLLVTVYFIILYHLRARKKSERVLRENEQLLRAIIDNSSSGIFVKSINGEYLMANLKFEKMFHPHSDKVIGKTDLQLFSDELAARLRSSDLDVVKEGRERVFEELIPHNGNKFTYEVIKFPLSDSQGRAYAVAGIVNDITLNKSEQEILLESQSQFQTLFDHAPDAIIVTDEDSRIIKWNPKAAELFGWTEEDVRGNYLPDQIIPTKFRESRSRFFKPANGNQAGSGVNRKFETNAIDKNSREFNIELTVSVASSRAGNLYICFVREITERVQMERQTREARNFLDSIVENIPDMIFVKDAEELRFVRFNSAGEKLLGYTSKELIGKNDYDFFPKEQADHFVRKDRKVLEDGKLLDIPEEKIDTKDGTRWLHTKKIPITDDKGQPVFLLGISEDITERKQLEVERTAAIKDLRENERKLSLIIENIGEGVMVIDKNLKIILYNKMVAEIFGNDRRPSAKWSDIFDIYFPDGITVYPAQDLPLEKALKGDSSGETELVFEDPASKATKLVKVTGHPIYDENNVVIAAVATLRDITRFRQLETALHESEVRYRNMIGFKRNSNGGKNK